MSLRSSPSSLGRAELALKRPMLLAEGPTWDAERNSLLWVDIIEGSVYSGRLRRDGQIQIEQQHSFPDTAGAVAVAETGEWIVAGEHRLYVREANGRVTGGPTLIEGADRRFNDGKVDPQGRFVVGTKGPTDHEVLLRIELDGSTTTIDDDLTLSNGLGWTADGTRMFSVDSLTRRIFVRDYSADRIGPRTLFATVEDGIPDGLTVDREGHVWVAIWGRGQVLRFSPTGGLVGQIEVPAPYTSSLTFAGPDLDTLVITTAREGLSDQELSLHPLSGSIFSIRPGAVGFPPSSWAGPKHSQKGTE